MSGLLNNPWIVSLISGALVLVLSELITRKRAKNTYANQINLANREVISILQPYVADHGLPDIDIINSIISSVGREYIIRKEDIYTPEIICEELVNEVISNVYVSGEMKKEYTENLIEYKKHITGIKESLNDEKKSNEDKKKVDEVDNKYRDIKTRRRVSLVSLFLSIMTMFLTMLITLLTGEYEQNIFKDINQEIILIVVSSLSVIIISTIILFLRTRRLKRWATSRYKPHYSYKIRR